MRRLRCLTAVLAVAAVISALVSLSHTFMLAESVASDTRAHGPADFSMTMPKLAARLLALEGRIQELGAQEAEGGMPAPTPPPGKARAGKASPPAAAFSKDSSRRPPAPSPPAQVAAPKVSLGMRFLDGDERCGGSLKLPDGGPVECNPKSDAYCCSDIGWCGSTNAHCHCRGCIDYRLKHARRESFPEPPPRDSHLDHTIVVVVPFRDREVHLELFKKFWRWFASEGSPKAPHRVRRWEIYILEQFDSRTFNRGWNFNVGLAIASAQLTSSPDISQESGVDFDCAVIQDIDYLPEVGVDYADCGVPIQLSAEIDRYDWKTPYLLSAGGIVSASLKHWRAINGFSNEYYGWGGEDDELHHRFRLNGLLYGDCYPYCKDNDTDKGKSGISIKRPPKGLGRFSGKLMHSANHTKRITDNAAYQTNLQLLQEIHKGSERWRGDGLSNLAFRVVSHDVDRADTKEYGVTYHHYRVHRGQAAFDLSSVPLAASAAICGGEGWSSELLGDGIPFDLASLRARAAALAGCSAAEASHVNFVLVDRRWHLAKILSDEDPRLLITYYRSLGEPGDDGLIIADGRSAGRIREAFERAGAFLVPPTPHSTCACKLEKGGMKFSIHPTAECHGAGWQKIVRGYFKAYVRPRNGLEAVSYCENSKYWTQHIVRGSSCGGSWSGLNWLEGHTFYVPKGHKFCIGSRSTDDPEVSFSKVAPLRDCGGDGFAHELNFGSVEDTLSPPALTVCVLRSREEPRVKVALAPNCKGPGLRLATRFPARSREVAKSINDVVICVAADVAGRAGDLLKRGSDCGPGAITFAVPVALMDPAAAGERTICSSSEGIQLGAACGGAASDLSFEAPGPLDTASSTPENDVPPLYSLIEEETSCFGFLCAGALKNVLGL